MRVRRELTHRDARAKVTSVLLGIVGYAPVPEAYPLGPALLARLQGETWDGVSPTIEPMGWGALHIVQALQASAARYDRVVLIGAVQRGRAPGTVVVGRWQGGTLAPAALQERVFEAVTGVVSLDNLLAIGEHFAVWPPEVFTVELSLDPAAFGALVMATSAGGRDHAAAARQALGFDPMATVVDAATLATQLAHRGAAAPLPIESRSAATLARVGRLSSTDFVATGAPGFGERARS
jgi:hypothetical protein